MSKQYPARRIKKNYFAVDVYEPLVSLADESKTPSEFFNSAKQAIEVQESLRDKIPSTKTESNPSPAATSFLKTNVDWIFNWLPRLIKKTHLFLRPAFSVIILIILLLGLYWLFFPQTYSDCILRNMTGVENDRAAKEIRLVVLPHFHGHSVKSSLIGHL